MNEVSEINTNPCVYVVLLNWNGWRDTIECLYSLKQATYSNLHIVIVDNASTDNSILEIRKWAQLNCMFLFEYILESRLSVPEADTKTQVCRTSSIGISLIKSLSNLGFCAGNNVGMEFAERNNADYFLILNNDTVCKRNFIEPLVHVAMEEDNVGLVGGLIYYAETPEAIWWAGGKFGLFLEIKLIRDTVVQKTSPTEWIIGCMMLIPRKCFITLGGFDESFFIWCEDIELSLRVKKFGYKILFVPESVIFHKVSQSIGYCSPMAYYYSARNTLILKKKYLGRMAFFVYFIYFLIAWIIRFCLFTLRGRFNLARAGFLGLRDYFFGYIGERTL